jgi:tetratricopeptide (TPR) repeat protein
VISPRFFDRGDRPELRELVDAVGADRRTEARLTGGFQWGPVPSVTRGTVDPNGAAVDLAISHIKRDRPKTSDPKIIAAAGVGALVIGDIDNAISELTTALDEDESNAFVWSDLSAAHLERGRVAGATDSLQEALRAADRALALAPNLAEALFNRALALSHLDRRDEARTAWMAYLQQDPDSPWADEARARIGVRQKQD